MSDAIEAERKRAIAAIHWVFNADGTVGERAMAQEAIHKINDPTFMPPLAAPVEPAADFDGWWSSDGQYVDPDTSEVPWFDKRRGLAEYAYAAGKTSALTAYEAATGVGVEVKPLEWEEFERGSGTVYAISIFGRYSAWREGEYGRYETPEGYRSRSIDRGIEAAKAAAQADYEARIRSALTSPASEVEQIIAASTRMAKRLGVAFEIDPAKVEQFIRGTSPASGPTRATAWENIHNGAIRRVEPSDPENYIALGPITSPASGERDAVIEECAKVVDGFVTHRPVFETEDEGGIKWENGGEEIPVLASKIAAALRMEGK